IREGHQMEVNSLCFSPNGRTFASASLDHRIRLWDMKSDKQLQPHTGHQETPIALGFLRGGSTLASLAKDRTMRWWDWRKGKQERLVSWPDMTVFYPEDSAPRIGLAPGGDMLALGSEQGSIHLVDTTSGVELSLLTDSNAPIVATAFSPDGKSLVSTDGKKVHLWDLPT